MSNPKLELVADVVVVNGGVEGPDTLSAEYLWYVPNEINAGHRGDDRGRPDSFTVATALASRATTFQPLIAVRPSVELPVTPALPNSCGSFVRSGRRSQ